MNRTKAGELAEIMKRYADGEIVQWQMINCPQGAWYHLPEPPFQHNKGYIFRVLDFPEPPKGQTFHNPHNLTATQVGVHEGWRLLLKSEAEGPLDFRKDASYYSDGQFKATQCDGSPGSYVGGHHASTTFRTKEPLPKPEPTPEELEQEAMEAALAKLYENDPPLAEFRRNAFNQGWKAHAAYLKGLK